MGMGGMSSAHLHSDGREGFRELPWAPDAVFKADTSDLSQQYGT